MTESSKSERIKMCLECNRLIPFEAGSCPFCHSSQSTNLATKCIHCSTALQSFDLLCPGCGVLALLTAPAPPLRATEKPKGGENLRFYGLVVWVVMLLASLLLAWLVMDYLVF